MATSRTLPQRQGETFKRLYFDIVVKVSAHDKASEEVKKYLENVDCTTTLQYFIDMRTDYNKDKTKVQVIDEFGRTAWVPVEQAKNHQVPMYTNGAARITSNYRVMYVGERRLEEFINAYFNIDSPEEYKNGTWYMKEDVEQGMKEAKALMQQKGWSNFSLDSLSPEEEGKILSAYPHIVAYKNCFSRIDHLKEMFEGDFSEITDAVPSAMGQRVKVMLGVREYNGDFFQDVFNRAVLRGFSTKYDKFQKELDAAMEAGAYANSFFEAKDVHEFKGSAPQPTDFSQTDENPFDTPTDSPVADSAPDWADVG